METIAQKLRIKKFPFIIHNEDGKELYYEDSEGYWFKREYDSENRLTYYQDSCGSWQKKERNPSGQISCYEDSSGYWYKKEFDANNQTIYFEDSSGHSVEQEYDSVDKDKVIYYKNSKGRTFDYREKRIEMTISEIAKKLGIDSKLLFIKE